MATHLSVGLLAYLMWKALPPCQLLYKPPSPVTLVKTVIPMGEKCPGGVYPFVIITTHITLVRRSP